MSNVKHLLGMAMVVTAALTVVGSAAAFTGPPVVNQKFRPPPDVHPETWCGQVDGTAVDTTVEHFMADGSGNIIDNVRFTQVFTATATGNAIVSSASTTDKTLGPIDNGDGTISFVTTINGLALKFRALNGAMLKAADGEPLRSAGVLVFEDVFDAATGDYITTNVSFKGPHLGAEGVDFCGPSVAYLLDT